MASGTEQLEDALSRVSADAPILLDFDETLWLRNSTEAFLDSARPRWLAALLLRALDVTRPWSLLPGPDRDHVWKDWLRLLVILVVMPWTLLAWRRSATGVAAPHWNQPIVTALRKRSHADLFVISNGWRCIIAPMLRGSTAPSAQLLAAPLWGAPAWRRRGKRHIVEASLGVERTASAVFVTDDRRDADLLDAVAVGIHTTWPGAAYLPAQKEIYVPFDYIEKVKRPGARWFLRNLVADELPIILLAYAWFAAEPLWALPILVLLHLSFWTVYEAGYVENDRLGQQREPDPALTAEFLAGGDRHYSEVGAWLYALALTVLAASLFALAGLPTSSVVVEVFGLAENPWIAIGEEIGAWMALLVAVRLLFHLYNLMPKRSRAVPHLLLQFGKCMGLMVWLDLEAPGVALLTAHALSRWLPYFLYRYGALRQPWAAPDKELRLVLFLLLMVIFAFSEIEVGPSDVLPVGLMTLFLAYRVRQMHRGEARGAAGSPIATPAEVMAPR